jgi:hypothetical protein
LCGSAFLLGFGWFSSIGGRLIGGDNRHKQI